VDGGLALVSEEGPDLLLVVEAHDETSSDLLKEGILLDLPQDGDALGLPAHADGAGAMPFLRELVELCDAFLDEALQSGIGG
jgi:hypothetical protein